MTSPNQPSGRQYALKVVPPYFDALLDGSKTFEVRKNDRGFQRGDELVLEEYDPSRGDHDRCSQPGCTSQRYTGRQAICHVTYVYAGDPRWPALQPGYVVLGLDLGSVEVPS